MEELHRNILIVLYFCIGGVIWVVFVFLSWIHKNGIEQIRKESLECEIALTISKIHKAKEDKKALLKKELDTLIKEYLNF